MFLGGYDTNFFEGALNFHKVVRKSWWTLSLDKVKIGGKDTNLCNKKTKCEIIMDTGASLMATPPQMYSTFIDLLSKSASCTDLKTFPKIEFQIEDQTYVLDGYEYILNDENDLEYNPDQ